MRIVRGFLRVFGLDHKILYLDSQLQKIYMQNKMQRYFCFQDHVEKAFGDFEKAYGDLNFHLYLTFLQTS
jgi:hypothetical protein